MSPTQNYHKMNDRKLDYLSNNNHINNNRIFDNNLVFETMPDLQPILAFDDNENADEVDGNIPSTNSPSKVGSDDQKPNNSKKEKFKVSEALVRKQAPTFLLIESLIWNLCRSKETEPKKQKLLFNSLCKQLNSLQIIGTSYKSDSLQPIREFIVDKFNDLILQIRTKDKSFGSLLSCGPVSNPVIDSPHSIHQSRYRDDFDDLGLIEAGGFGVVNRAKNRFDNCEYAVKMIRFKYTDKYDTVFTKIIREVTIYANLSSHPNVVAYKTAWLENWCLHREGLPLSKHMKTNKDNEMPSKMDDIFDSIPNKDNENDVSIRFEESSKSGIRIESSNRQISKTEEITQTIKMEYREEGINDDDEDNSSDEESSDSNSSVEMSNLQSFDSDLRAITKRRKTVSMSSTQSQSDGAVDYRNFELQKYHKQNIPDIKVDTNYQTNGCPFSCSDFGAILYIQMELCGKNLKTWLRERNQTIFDTIKERKAKLEDRPLSTVDLVNKRDVKNIFRQVLKGVEYIHSQHLIHRDLKPQNILFSIDGTTVKIGDFGLATLHNSIDNEVISIGLYKQSTSWSQSSLNSNSDLNHTGNIGTSIYASPEQKSRKDYDNKTDMFSLGLILFELFYPLSTDMEKANCVHNITKKQILPKPLIKSCPNVSKIILSLTNPNPLLRPTVYEVLHSSMFLSEEELIIKQVEDQNNQLVNQLVIKDNQIKELENSLQIERTINAEKDIEIQVLRKQLEDMTHKMKYFS